MKHDGMRRLPFNRASLVIGILSVPLAFAGHLVTLALVLGGLALLLGSWNAMLLVRNPGRYQPGEGHWVRWAMGMGLVGTLASISMWELWADGRLF